MLDADHHVEELDGLEWQVGALDQAPQPLPEARASEGVVRHREQPGERLQARLLLLLLAQRLLRCDVALHFHAQAVGVRRGDDEGVTEQREQPDEQTEAGDSAAPVCGRGQKASPARELRGLGDRELLARTPLAGHAGDERPCLSGSSRRDVLHPPRALELVGEILVDARKLVGARRTEVAATGARREEAERPGPERPTLDGHHVDRRVRLLRRRDRFRERRVAACFVAVRDHDDDPRRALFLGKSVRRQDDVIPERRTDRLVDPDPLESGDRVCAGLRERRQEERRGREARDTETVGRQLCCDESLGGTNGLLERLAPHRTRTVDSQADAPLIAEVLGENACGRGALLGQLWRQPRRLARDHGRLRARIAVGADAGDVDRAPSRPRGPRAGRRR